MGLLVRPHPGFRTATCFVPSAEFAKAIVLALIDSGCHFYVEPYPNDEWMFKVDTEHEALLRQLVGG